MNPPTRPVPVDLTLREVLTGDSPAAAAQRALLLELVRTPENEPRPLAAAMAADAEAWRTFYVSPKSAWVASDKNHARRLDHLDVFHLGCWVVHFPADPTRSTWQVELPLTAHSLTAAMAEVDERFPMAPWFFDIRVAGELQRASAGL